MIKNRKAKAGKLLIFQNDLKSLFQVPRLFKTLPFLASVLIVYCIGRAGEDEWAVEAEWRVAGQTWRIAFKSQVSKDADDVTARAMF